MNLTSTPKSSPSDKTSAPTDDKFAAADALYEAIVAKQHVPPKFGASPFAR
jgi:hypothetical protein